MNHSWTIRAHTVATETLETVLTMIDSDSLLLGKDAVEGSHSFY